MYKNGKRTERQQSTGGGAAAEIASYCEKANDGNVAVAMAPSTVGNNWSFILYPPSDTAHCPLCSCAALYEHFSSSIISSTRCTDVVRVYCRLEKIIVS